MVRNVNLDFKGMVRNVIQSFPRSQLELAMTSLCTATTTVTSFCLIRVYFIQNVVLRLVSELA